jgi:UDPglucose 6-dehydrogenase
MKVTVVGTGYVGLVTGACLADVGNDVMCLDVDDTKIKGLQIGVIPIFEPGLREMVGRNVAAGRLQFTSNVQDAVRFGTVQFIAVGTPSDQDGSADMQYVIAAARSIGRYMDEYKVVVNKSTVPVGTADAVQRAVQQELDQRSTQVAFSVVSNPEFLKEGAAIDDFMKPDRIIVGCDDDAAIQAMRAVYAPFQRNHEKLIVMDARSAELTKYAANAMLATRISFMNELANLAETLGADIEQVRKGIGSDPRIGYDFLYAGAGYGGSCFPKDVKALIRTAQEDAGMQLRILREVEAVNDAQKHVLGRKILARFGTDLTGRHFALWGLAFKANTDDMREATSRTVIADLLGAGATVTAYDPQAMAEARRHLPNQPGIRYAESPLAALDEADALVIVTEWKEFRSPDFDTIRSKLRQPLIFDGRNLYEPAVLRGMGFEYHAIGR